MKLKWVLGYMVSQELIKEKIKTAKEHVTYMLNKLLAESNIRQKVIVIVDMD